MDNRNLIQDRFQAETSLLRLERQQDETEAALRQAKFDLREAKAAQAEYSGSFKSFRDKLTGKREETETALRHTVQKAEADLTAAQQQKELLRKQLSQLKAQLKTLPDWESFNDGSREWYRLEALYCIEAVLPLLERSHTDLLELRKMMGGANPGKIYTHAEIGQIGTDPIHSAANCASCLTRLKAAAEALALDFPGCDYFEAPAGFLNTPAAVHNRRDKLNEAIDQVQMLLNRLPKLQKQIAE